VSIIKVIEFEEGFRSTPYLCSEDFVTIGYGTKLHKAQGMDPSSFLVEVDRTVAGAWLQKELDKIQDRISASDYYSKIFYSLNEDRQSMILNMGYQLGVTGLYNFKNMWAALKTEDYNKAATEALDSRWAKQTPERAERVAEVIRSGSMDEVYKRFTN
tara:strand:+ start:1941 stop:2414 length:474 start_codon:yes stop_codon:yes gene_type:complete